MTETGFRNITKAHFENYHLKVFGKTVTRYTATITTDHRGNTSISYAAGASITAVLQRYSGNPKKERNKEGMLRVVDAYLACSVDTTIAEGDKVKDNDTSEVYRVLTKKNERGVYVFCQLYYYEDGS